MKNAKTWFTLHNLFVVLGVASLLIFTTSCASWHHRSEPEPTNAPAPTQAPAAESTPAKAVHTSNHATYEPIRQWAQYDDGTPFGPGIAIELTDKGHNLVASTDGKRIRSGKDLSGKKYLAAIDDEGFLWFNRKAFQSWDPNVPLYVAFDPNTWTIHKPPRAQDQLACQSDGWCFSQVVLKPGMRFTVVAYLTGKN